jgi:hypothetical protein
MMRNLQIIATLAVGVTAAACGTKDAPSPLAPSGPTGRVRFVNMITDTTRGRVNAILEGVPFGVNLTYGQSTPATLPAPSTANYSAILAGNVQCLEAHRDTTNVVATVALPWGPGGPDGVRDWRTTEAPSLRSSSRTRTLTRLDGDRLRVVNLPRGGRVDVFLTRPIRSRRRDAAFTGLA